LIWFLRSHVGFCCVVTLITVCWLHRCSVGSLFVVGLPFGFVPVAVVLVLFGYGYWLRSVYVTVGLRLFPFTHTVYVYVPDSRTHVRLRLVCYVYVLHVAFTLVHTFVWFTVARFHYVCSFRLFGSVAVHHGLVGSFPGSSSGYLLFTLFGSAVYVRSFGLPRLGSFGLFTFTFCLRVRLTVGSGSFVWFVCLVTFTLLVWFSCWLVYVLPCGSVVWLVWFYVRWVYVSLVRFASVTLFVPVTVWLVCVAFGRAFWFSSVCSGSVLTTVRVISFTFVGWFGYAVWLDRSCSLVCSLVFGSLVHSFLFGCYCGLVGWFVYVRFGLVLYVLFGSFVGSAGSRTLLRLVWFSCGSLRCLRWTFVVRLVGCVLVVYRCLRYVVPFCVVCDLPLPLLFPVVGCSLFGLFVAVGCLFVRFGLVRYGCSRSLRSAVRCWFCVRFTLFGFCLLLVHIAVLLVLPVWFFGFGFLRLFAFGWFRSFWFWFPLRLLFV